MSGESTPWNFLGKSISIKAYTVVKGLRTDIRPIYPVSEMMWNKITLLPGQHKADAIDLDRFYILKDRSGVAVFVISFPSQVQGYGSQMYSMRGPIVILAFPSESLWRRSCPVVTVLDSPA